MNLEFLDGSDGPDVDNFVESVSKQGTPPYCQGKPNKLPCNAKLVTSPDIVLPQFKGWTCIAYCPQEHCARVYYRCEVCKRYVFSARGRIVNQLEKHKCKVGSAQHQVLQEREAERMEATTFLNINPIEKAEDSIQALKVHLYSRISHLPVATLESESNAKLVGRIPLIILQVCHVVHYYLEFRGQAQCGSCEWLRKCRDHYVKFVSRLPGSQAWSPTDPRALEAWLATIRPCLKEIVQRDDTGWVDGVIERAAPPSEAVGSLPSVTEPARPAAAYIEEKGYQLVWASIRNLLARSSDSFALDSWDNLALGRVGAVALIDRFFLLNHVLEAQCYGLECWAACFSVASHMVVLWAPRLLTHFAKLLLTYDLSVAPELRSRGFVLFSSSVPLVPEEVDENPAPEGNREASAGELLRAVGQAMAREAGGQEARAEGEKCAFSTRGSRLLARLSGTTAPQAPQGAERPLERLLGDTGPRRRAAGAEGGGWEAWQVQLLAEMLPALCRGALELQLVAAASSLQLASAQRLRDSLLHPQAFATPASSASLTAMARGGSRQAAATGAALVEAEAARAPAELFCARAEAGGAARWQVRVRARAAGSAKQPQRSLAQCSAEQTAVVFGLVRGEELRVQVQNLGCKPMALRVAYLDSSREVELARAEVPPLLQYVPACDLCFEAGETAPCGLLFQWGHFRLLVQAVLIAESKDLPPQRSDPELLTEIEGTISDVKLSAPPNHAQECCVRGHSLLLHGRFSEAVTWYQQGLNIAVETGDKTAAGNAYGNLGNALMCLRQFEKALEMHSHHRSIAVQQGDKAAESAACLGLGNVHAQLEEHSKASDEFERALALARDSGNVKLSMTACSCLGRAYHSQGEFQRAIEMQQHAFEIANQEEAWKTAAAACRDMGCSYQELRQYEEAIRQYRLHLEISHLLGDKAGVAQAFAHLADAHLAHGDVEKAIEIRECHVEISRERGDRDDELEGLAALANMYHAQGEVDKAVERHQRRLEIALELQASLQRRRREGSASLAHSEDDGDRAQTRVGAGGVAGEICTPHTGRPATAPSGPGALHGMPSSGSFLHAKSTRAVAASHKKRATGALDREIALLHQLISDAQERQDGSAEAEAGLNLGSLFEDVRKFKSALGMFDRCLMLARILGDAGLEGKACGGLGRVSDSLGRHAKALKLHDRQLECALKTGDRAEMASAYTGLGNALYSLGRFQECVEKFQQDLKILQECGLNAARSYGNLGNAFRSLGDHEKSMEMYERCLHFCLVSGDMRAIALALNNFGALFLITCNVKRGLEMACWGLRAVQEAEQAVDSNDDGLRIALLESQRGFYSLYAGCLILMQKGKLALALAELAKARVLVKEIGAGEGFLHFLGAGHGDGDGAAGGHRAITMAEEQWQQVERLVRAEGCTMLQYAFVPPFLAVWVVSSAGDLSGTWLLHTDPRDASARGLGCLSLHGLLSLVDAAMEFGHLASQADTMETRAAATASSVPMDEGDSDGEETKAVHAWWQCLHQERAGDAKWEAAVRALQAQASTWRQLLGLATSRAQSGSGTLGAGEAEDADTVLRRARALPELLLSELHLRLIEPVASALPAGAELLVVAHRALFRVPWAALRSSSGHHLIQQHPLRIVPSLRVAAAASSALRDYREVGHEASRRAVLVTNPLPTRKVSLVWAEQEAEAVAQALRGSFPAGVTQLSGQEATKVAVLKAMSGASWVHLACHAEVLADAEGSEGEQVLLMAQEGECEGELSMQDLLAVELARGATVVLSACSSMGRRMAEEGPVGLARSFLLSGAGTVVVSLSDVNDNAALALMQRFYEQHVGGGLCAGEALRQATLVLAGLEPVVEQRAGPSVDSQAGQIPSTGAELPPLLDEAAGSGGRAGEMGEIRQRELGSSPDRLDSGAPLGIPGGTDRFDTANLRSALKSLIFEAGSRESALAGGGAAVGASAATRGSGGGFKMVAAGSGVAADAAKLHWSHWGAFLLMGGSAKAGP